MDCDPSDESLGYFRSSASRTEPSSDGCGALREYSYRTRLEKEEEPHQEHLRLCTANPVLDSLGLFGRFINHPGDDFSVCDIDRELRARLPHCRDGQHHLLV